MRPKTLLRVLCDTDPIVPLVAMGMFKPFYRLSFLAAVASNGLLELLAAGPMSFEQLAARYCREESQHDALRAWLQMGMRLKALKLNDRGYALKGIARKLAAPKNEAWMAVIQEVVGLHHKLILHTPQKLKAGQLWQLEDQDGDLIAKSSRTLEPFQLDAIDRTFPAKGAVRLLEIGCGSGFYIKYAAEKNPDLTALGLELQPQVADMATENIRAWGLQDRVAIECRDVRDKQPDETFDIVTLHNNIYYFTVDERVALLAHIRKCLAPNGFLLATTGCQGGSVALESLNLWAAATAGCGWLPEVKEMLGYYKDAGYVNPRSIRLIPGDKYYAFVGYQGQ